MGLRAISERRLSMRAGATAVALVLAASGLSACRTNVGDAAIVDGHRVSESDVNNYLTDKAMPITSGSAKVAPRSFVLLFLIDDRLVTKLLATPPAKTPTLAQVDTETASAVKASGGRAAVIKAVGLGGYTPAFQDLFIRTSVLQILLHQQAGDTQNQESIAAIAKALKFDPARSFPVKVNPRYGTWSPTRLTMNTAETLPPYLTLQSTPAT